MQHLQRYAGVSQTAEPRKHPLLSGILDVGLGNDFLLRSREGQSEDIVTECASGLLVRFLVFYFILFFISVRNNVYIIQIHVVLKLPSERPGAWWHLHTARVLVTWA
jgi:hypothetical protein